MATAALACALVGALGGCGSGSGGGGSASNPAARTATERPSSTPPPASLRSSGVALALQVPISGEALVSGGGELLALGGVDAGDVSTNAVVRVLPEQGSARNTGSLAQPLHDAAATVLGKRTLLFGGGSAATTDEVESIPASGAGTVVGHMPVPRSDLSAVSARGDVYVVGGYDGTEAVGAVLATRDGRSFRIVGKLPVPVRYAAVIASGASIWVLGGEQSDGSDTDAIQEIDLDSGAIRVAGHLPGTLAHASIATIGGSIFLIGGRLDGSTSDAIFRLDPTTATVRPAGTLPAPIQNAAAAAGGSVYLVGGLTADGTPVADVLRLRPMP